MNTDLLHLYRERFQTGGDVVPGDAEGLFDAIIGEPQIEPLIDLFSAWTEKGTSEDELYEFAAIMRRRMRRIETRHTAYVDTVGTGGSSSKTFNVSTAAAFVIAGAGVAVAKHGNRAATSRSGSADVLGMLGIDVDIDPEHAQRHLDEHGISFLFAPRFHRLSPILAQARRAFGRPTIFNNLGPLCNPASAPHHIIGVAGQEMFEMTARVLARLGTSRSWVVRSDAGLDEISLDGITQISEINGAIRRFETSAREFGVTASADEIPLNCTAAESGRLIRGILDNEFRDQNAEKLVIINAAAAIYVAAASTDLRSAAEFARDSIRSGNAKAKLNALVAEGSK